MRTMSLHENEAVYSNYSIRKPQVSQWRNPQHLLMIFEPKCWAIFHKKRLHFLYRNENDFECWWQRYSSFWAHADYTCSHCHNRSNKRSWPTEHGFWGFVQYLYRCMYVQDIDCLSTDFDHILVSTFSVGVAKNGLIITQF